MHCTKKTNSSFGALVEATAECSFFFFGPRKERIVGSHNKRSVDLLICSWARARDSAARCPRLLFTRTLRVSLASPRLHDIKKHKVHSREGQKHQNSALSGQSKNLNHQYWPTMLRIRRALFL